MKNSILYNIFLYIFSIFMSFNMCFNFIEEPYAKVIIFLVSILLFFVFKFVLKKLEKVNINTSKKIQKREFIIYSIMIISILMFVFFMNHNNLINGDVISQIEQVKTGKYENWHPVFYTFIMIGIPYKIFKTIDAIILFQLLFVILILLYFCYFMRKYFLNFSSLIILLLIMLLNPVFVQSTVMLEKDVIFSFFMMLGTMFLIEIFLTNGDWLKYKKNKIMFIIMCICISNFRHNGIANYLLMMFLLIYFYKKYRKFLIISFIFIIGIKVIITGPVFKKLGIPPSGGISEMLGIPFNQISYMYNNKKEFTDHQLNIMDQIIPLEVWENNYNISNFNMIKCESEFSYYSVTKYKYDILKMYIFFAKKYPIETMYSYFHVTYPVYGIMRKKSFLEPILDNFGDDNSTSKTNWTKIYLSRYYFNLNQPVTIYRLFILDVGNSLCFILFSLFVIKGRYKNNIKRFIPYILPVSNAVIIMFLMTAEEVRFLLPSLLCLYPLFIFSLSNNMLKNN